MTCLQAYMAQMGVGTYMNILFDESVITFMNMR